MARKTYTLKMRTKLILTMMILAYFLFLFIQQSFEISSKQKTMDELREAISDAEHENEILSRQIEYSKSKEYIEQVARDRLGWVKEGETIFIENNQ